MARKAAAILLCGLIFSSVGCKDSAEPAAQNEPSALTLAATPTPEFTSQVESLRAQGYPVSLDDLEARYKLPEGVENAADLYIEAFEYYQEPTEAELEYLPVIGRYSRSSHTSPLPSKCVDTMKSFLARNHKTLELIDKAARMEHCMLPRTRYEDHIRTEHRVKILEGAFLVCIRNIYLTQSQQTDELSESLQTSLALAKALVLQPFMLDYFTCLSINRKAVYSLETALNITTLDEEELVTLQKKIGHIQKKDMSNSVLLNERVFAIRYFQLPPQKHIEDLPERLMKDNEDKAIQYYNSGSYWDDAVRAIDYIQACIDIQQRPVHEQLIGLDKIIQEIDASPNPMSSWFLGMIRNIVNGMKLSPRETGAGSGAVSFTV